MLSRLRKILKNLIGLENIDNLGERIAFLEEKNVLLEQQNSFLLFELQKTNELFRSLFLNNPELMAQNNIQTLESFDYQWNELSTGSFLPSDGEFMKGLTDTIEKYTGFSSDWFKGKNVLDVGCGLGRFTYGFLSMGAKVLAVDNSKWGLERTSDLCRNYSDNLMTRKVDILKWDEPGTYDIVFCYGVVHHTGNTYLALTNVAKKVKQGGRLFLMVYGFPKSIDDFIELNSYESLRNNLRTYSFEKKKKYLIEKFGDSLAHGWFDAISPRINDLLDFNELEEYLIRQGFTNITSTISSRNHHLIADKV